MKSRHVLFCLWNITKPVTFYLSFSAVPVRIHSPVGCLVLFPHNIFFICCVNKLELKWWMGCSRQFGSCLPRPQCTCTVSCPGSWPSGAAVCVQFRTSTPVQPSPLRLNAWLTSGIRYSLRVCPPPGLVTYQLIFIYFNAARCPVL